MRACTSVNVIVVYTTSPLSLGYGWMVVPVIDRVTGWNEFEVCCASVLLSGVVLFSDTVFSGITRK